VAPPPAPGHPDLLHDGHLYEIVFDLHEIVVIVSRIVVDS
jgi:hypothetical protein